MATKKRDLPHKYFAPQVDEFSEFWARYRNKRGEAKETEHGVRILKGQFAVEGHNIILQLVGTHPGKPEDNLVESEVIKAIGDGVFFKHHLQQISAQTVPNSTPGITGMNITFRALLSRPLLDKLGREEIDVFNQK